MRNCIVPVMYDVSTEPLVSKFSHSAGLRNALMIACIVSCSSGGAFIFCNAPSTRYTGGTPAFMCRSLTRIEPCLAKYSSRSRTLSLRSGPTA
jgi:hypothetical protein